MTDKKNKIFQYRNYALIIRRQEHHQLYYYQLWMPAGVDIRHMPPRIEMTKACN